MAERTAYTQLIRQTAELYSLPFVLLEAQVITESSGRADAFRYEPEFYQRYIQHNPAAPGFRYGPLAACSYGLMQVMLETALEAGFTDRPELLFDPRVNLRVGALRMAELREWAHGDLEQALAAYNGGKGGNGKRPFRNSWYVAQVLAKQAATTPDPLQA